MGRRTSCSSHPGVGCVAPVPGASTAAWRFPRRQRAPIVPRLPPGSRRDHAGRKALPGWSASGSVFDLRALTRFQVSRSNDCPPPPLGRGDNTSEPAHIAAISLLYGALIATNHAAHSRELQKQRAGPATPCAKSPELGFLHTHVRVCGYTQGSLTRLFALSHLHASSRWFLVGLRGPLRWM